MVHRKRNSKKMALSGLLTAVTVLLLYFAVILPFHVLFFTFLSSFPIVLLYRRSQLSTALLFFMTTGLLSFILFPHPRLLPYVLFFGHYGLAKVYLEEKGGRYAIFLKILYFNLSLLIGWFFFRLLLLPFMPTISPPLLLLFLQFFFLIYDYSFTAALSFFTSRIERVI